MSAPFDKSDTFVSFRGNNIEVKGSESVCWAYGVVICGFKCMAVWCAEVFVYGYAVREGLNARYSPISPRGRVTTNLLP